MKLIIKTILLSVCFFFPIRALAQADISMATHWYNRANYNPASIARTDYIYLFSNARSQWNDVVGSPTVFNVQASEYIHNLHSAFGLSLISDKIGMTHSLSGMINYAFRISNNDWSFSMGLAGGVSSRFVDVSLYDPVTVIDPLLSSDLDKINYPDANLGVEFESSHFILGLSSTHLFAIGKQDKLFLNTNHRYAYAIYKNTDFDIFNYNAGLQVVNRNNLTVLEVNGSIRFKQQTGLINESRETFDIGLTYRTSQQMTFLFGVNLSQNLKVGFAYDKSFFPGYFQNSTNEIILEYRIPSKASSICFQCEKQKNWYH